METYRDKLYALQPETTLRAIHESDAEDPPQLPTLPPRSEYEEVRQSFKSELQFMVAPWRFPLWQVANQPELFAFKSHNYSDGICLIERIDLPDGRVVIACISVAGNPGISITNAVEDICFQVCERFEIPPNRIVWLEHYDQDVNDEWYMVKFGETPPAAPFADPAWTTMTPELWATLLLKPKKRLLQSYGQYESKLKKLFHWPTENII